MDRDLSKAFPTLRGGIRILNPVEGRPGTLGLVCTRDGVDRWIVSCYHVLCRMNRAPFLDGEPIYQPIDDAQNLVGRLVMGMANSVADVAAARVIPGRETASDIIGLPAVVGVEDPVAGMEVIKCGMTTGVTDGVIESVNGNRVRIKPRVGYATDYSISRVGDSGAIWINRNTAATVAMNQAGEDTGEEVAFAIPFRVVLSTLGLRMVNP